MIGLFLGLLVLFLIIVLKKNEPTPRQEANTEVVASISSQELTAANGKEGNECYVVLSGTVYKITQDDDAWKDGAHTPSKGQAYCGKDLTDVIDRSPHGNSILPKLIKVGTMQS